MSARDLRRVLQLLVDASYDHLASNGDVPVGRDGRQFVTPTMIFADHAILEALAEARKALGIVDTHDGLIAAGRRRNEARMIARLGKDGAALLMRKGRGTATSERRA